MTRKRESPFPAVGLKDLLTLGGYLASKFCTDEPSVD